MSTSTSRNKSTDTKTEQAASKRLRECVEIARDVVRQVRAGRLRATTRMYVDTCDSPLSRAVEKVRGSADRPRKVDARTVVKRARTCMVCARGAVLLAAVCRFDEAVERIEKRAAGQGAASRQEDDNWWATHGPDPWGD